MSLLDRFMDWLMAPMDGHPEVDTTTANYEDRVEDECDHTWQRSNRQTEYLNFKGATYKEGCIIVPRVAVSEDYCRDCGTEYVETHPLAQRVRQNGDKLVIPVAFTIAKDLNTETALSKTHVDYEVDTEGDVTPVDDDDGAGRVIINESEQDLNFEVTD